MTGTPEPGLVELVHEVEALDPALEQGVDDDDVRAQLGDQAEHLGAVADDVQQLDRLLGR